MEKESLIKDNISEKVLKSAIKHYETYLTHCKLRNLIPMSLNDFLSNYMC